MTSIIHNFKDLNKAARLQEGGDDHYARNIDGCGDMLAGSASDLEAVDLTDAHFIFSYGKSKKHIDAQWITRAELPACTHPTDLMYGGPVASSVAHTHSFTPSPSIETRVSSILTNASVLRGTPEAKASSLMRLLEEQGLKIVERE